MKRGVVMSIQDNHAVVMTPDGRFMRAPLQGSPQVGEEIAFEDESAPGYRNRRRVAMLRYAGAAAAVCLLLAVCLLYATSKANSVVAYVTIDINPSVEIAIDGGKKVRALRALNEDAQSIIQGMRYKGVDVEQVAMAILEGAQSGHYLDSPYKDIMITSVMVDGRSRLELDFETLLTDKLDARLQEWLEERGARPEKVHIMTLSAPEELRLAADANGLSTGKMALYLMAKSQGYELELEQIRSQSIHAVNKQVGGIRSLVDGDEEKATTKQKLQSLLAEEQKAQASTQPSAESAAQPSAKPSPKPTVQPTASVRPQSSPGQSGRDTGWFGNGRRSDRESDDRGGRVGSDQGRGNNNGRDGGSDDKRGSGSDQGRGNGGSRGGGDDKDRGNGGSRGSESDQSRWNGGSRGGGSDQGRGNDGSRGNASDQSRGNGGSRGSGGDQGGGNDNSHGGGSDQGRNNDDNRGSGNNKSRWNDDNRGGNGSGKGRDDGHRGNRNGDNGRGR